ncbi:MAG: hypothetical protein LKJ44_00940 [Bifidobacteriaceae bacterium]|jgi:hypothetical protein|nr:hypothetical protein [Bifidobacteriaceae bacterium]
MPTFDNPSIDAAEASEALRGLAYASRVFDQPAAMYRVIGDLSAAMRSLHQVLEQVAANHEHRIPFAFDDRGDHETGVSDALTAAAELRQAARLVDQSYDRLAAGFSAAGRVAWHTQPAPDPEPGMALDRQWVTVVFLQGQGADEVLDMIDAHGVEAAIGHLSNWDDGEETTGAAIANRDVHDAIPAGTLDKTAESGVYTLTYNPFMGHVALYRHPNPTAVQEAAQPPQPESAARRRRVRDASYQQPARRPAADTPRGLGL